MKIKEKERTIPTFGGLNIGDVFRDEYGTVCMKIDRYNAKIYGDAGKLYEINAVSLKDAELRFYQNSSNAYPVNGTFVET